MKLVELEIKKKDLEKKKKELKEFDDKKERLPYAAQIMEKIKEIFSEQPILEFIRETTEILRIVNDSKSDLTENISNLIVSVFEIFFADVNTAVKEIEDDLIKKQGENQSKNLIEILPVKETLERKH